ncbi:helix-turn-helix transcriptional regulator [Amycolatopsis azurea]|uniref:helix-turn-helix transcriptional regulator n=1 Tax=Amycolatopsis azurea TaxID=36819 RepID=UPI00382BEBBC
MAKRTRFQRKRKEAGFLQQELADELGVYRSTVGRWEAGLTEPELEMRPRIATAFRCSLEELEDLLSEAIGPSEVSGHRDGRLPDGQVTSDSMRRRTLITFGVATSTAKLVGAKAYIRYGDADVRRLRRKTDRLCALDHQHGGEALWQAGLAEIDKANNMLEQGSYDTRVGADLLTATRDLQVRTGWLACDAGEHDVARSCFAEALAGAVQAGDFETKARALAGLGFRSNLLGRPREGLRYSGAAEEAVKELGPSSRLTAAPILTLAVANARSKNARGADAAIKRARKALDADRGEAAGSWAAFMSPMEIDGVEATCAVESGQAARAERLLERAIAGYDRRFARNIALYRVRLMDARIRSGAVDGAIEAADEVLDAMDDDEGECLESWRVNLELGRAMRAILSYRTAGVQELTERYKGVVVGQ